MSVILNCEDLFTSHANFAGWASRNERSDAQDASRRREVKSRTSPLTLPEASSSRRTCASSSPAVQGFVRNPTP